LLREQIARAEAEAANRTKDEFLSIVSHELRTPLAAILLWTELLKSGNLDASATTSALDIIERNAKSQSRLIEDLLDVSRIITGNLHLNIGLIELHPVIQSAVETLHLAASAKGIQIEIFLDSSVSQVLGDAARLQQVVSNLLSNAIKFTSDNGRVEIQLTATTHQALIIVRDTGQGINSEFLPYVFDRFRQGNSSSTRSGRGLGLGLAIARQLVELHRGTIRAESPGEGQGATFTVTIPLAVQTRTTTQEQLIQKSTSTVLNNSLLLRGLWVLVVDDDADMREAIAIILQQCGASVTTVSLAVEALEVLTQKPSSRVPDILLCDIGMPGQDGYTLLNQVRALPPQQGGQIPAIALTAYAREEDRTQALLIGFQLHLPKPINPIDLITAVMNLTSRK
jgi:CheY-like chemotaxis protein/two-component sensor histidine kinase